MKPRRVAEHIAILVSIPSALFLLVASVVGLFPGIVVAVIGALILESR